MVFCFQLYLMSTYRQFLGFPIEISQQNLFTIAQNGIKKSVIKTQNKLSSHFFCMFWLINLDVKDTIEFIYIFFVLCVRLRALLSMCMRESIFFSFDVVCCVPLLQFNIRQISTRLLSIHTHRCLCVDNVFTILGEFIRLFCII